MTANMTNRLLISFYVGEGHGGLYLAQKWEKVKGYEERGIRSNLLILDLKKTTRRILEKKMRVRLSTNCKLLE